MKGKWYQHKYSQIYSGNCFGKSAKILIRSVRLYFLFQDNTSIYDLIKILPCNNTDCSAKYLWEKEESFCSDGMNIENKLDGVGPVDNKPSTD